jgi:hypothetical protein
MKYLNDLKILKRRIRIGLWFLCDDEKKKVEWNK